MREVLRSGAFRIALAFATAVMITTYGVFAFVYWDVLNGDIEQVSSNLQYEVAKATDAPAAQVERELTLRLTDDLRRLDYVGLFSADGTLIYGNVVGGITIPVDGIAHLTTGISRASDGSQPAIFVARHRSDGGTLILGRSLVDVFRLQATMRWAFLVAVLPTILIALVLGIIASRSASHRLSAIQRAIKRVMQGELHVRLPVRGRTDGIGELVGAVNLMLDEIVRLLNQIKSVGDNIAHDLRTPLAVMRARLERGVESASDDVLRTTAQQAIGDLDRALTTVTALLRISELESGLQRSAFAMIDIVEVCRDVYDLFEPLAAAKEITMSLDVPPRHLMHGDADLLREAVANLVDNAVKYTPRGGFITLRCGRGGALLRVADSGPGIPSDERDEIFKRFYRSRHTAGIPGVGLGLSMASTIVALHGYVLRVGDNHPGAVFEIVAA